MTINNRKHKFFFDISLYLKKEKSKPRLSPERRGTMSDKPIKSRITASKLNTNSVTILEALKPDFFNKIYVFLINYF